MSASSDELFVKPQPNAFKSNIWSHMGHPGNCNVLHQKYGLEIMEFRKGEILKTEKNVETNKEIVVAELLWILDGNKNIPLVKLNSK